MYEERNMNYPGELHTTACHTRKEVQPGTVVADRRNGKKTKYLPTLSSNRLLYENYGLCFLQGQHRALSLTKYKIIIVIIELKRRFVTFPMLPSHAVLSTPISTIETASVVIKCVTSHLHV